MKFNKMVARSVKVLEAWSIGPRNRHVLVGLVQFKGTGPVPFQISPLDSP